jgi:uncharacterized repeat protein (TIGR03803 family)
VGGGAQGPNSYGTVFRIGPRGGQRTLHSFDIIENGQSPAAALVQATDGNFYGTTSGGGAHFYGTVFKITPGGSLTKLHSFGGPDGENPNSALIQAADGNLYGTTTSGGAGERYGTIFKISTSGIVMTLHSFDGSDGWAPNAALIQATDGNFYGTTSKGGRNDLNPCPDGCGTIFKITPSGTLTTLYNFCSQIQNDVCTDGAIPSAALIQDTNGTLYGTTGEGGANTNSSCTNGCGTVFSLSVGLGPFVETAPTSGTVGAAVNILGTNLTGATSVAFNGTAATFTVVSRSEITTAVPAAATTGTVQVVTPGGTLSSNVVFRVN